MENNSLRRSAWAILFILTAAMFAMVFIPAWIIQPFRDQSREGLEISYSLRSAAPAATFIASAIVLAAAALLWRTTSRLLLKAVMIAALIISFACAWFARQNHFEWMFNPLLKPAYAKASEVDFVDDADMVIAIENNGEAAAYPVRQIAYHHIIQDIVGGKPIVATY